MPALKGPAEGHWSRRWRHWVIDLDQRVCPIAWDVSANVTQPGALAPVANRVLSHNLTGPPLPSPPITEPFPQS